MTNNLFQDNNIQGRKKYFTHYNSNVNLSWIKEFKFMIPEIYNNKLLLNNIAKSYGYSSYGNYKYSPNSSRFRTFSYFRVNNAISNVKILNYSLQGICVSGLSIKNFKKGQVLLDCQISQYIKAQILVEPMWESNRMKNDNTIGCKIIDCSNSWLKMNEEVNKRSIDVESYEIAS